MSESGKNDYMGLFINILKSIFRKPEPAVIPLEPPQEKKPSKDVALVLGGGGARGYAHIGAIETLEAYGYHIKSISGNSMGALIGGLYAAGKLQEAKNAIDGLTKKGILKIFNISFGLDHIASGENLMALLDELIGDTRIEDLPINFCCNASDVVSGKEFVFREGSLKDAIRASISIPCLFKPFKMGEHIFVDGSVHNTLPLDKIERNGGELLVAVNVSAPDDEPFQAYLKKYGEPKNSVDKSLWNKIPFLKSELSANYMNMALRVLKMSVQNNTQMALKITPPDIYVEVPMNRFSLFDFDKGAEIIQYGRQIMEKALKDWEDK